VPERKAISFHRRNPARRSDKAQKAVHAIIDNSTYDGLTYLVPRVVELLDKSIDRIHFDEAWYGYATLLKPDLPEPALAMYGRSQGFIPWQANHLHHHIHP